MSIATTNAMKRSVTPEHLIKNPVCRKNYNKSCFSFLRKYTSYLDVIKLEAILIKLYKPKLCKQKDLIIQLLC